MFNIENEYIKESSSATINQHKNKNAIYFKGIFLVGTITLIGYLGFHYINSSEASKKSRVMGVSYTKDDIQNSVDNYSDKSQKVQYRNTEDISNELNSMVDAFYNKKASIPIELSGIVDEFYKEDSGESKDRIITVKEGDTLALIAQRFYGDAMKYKKILDANRELKKTTTLYIGQKIKIPY